MLPPSFFFAVGNVVNGRFLCYNTNGFGICVFLYRFIDAGTVAVTFPSPKEKMNFFNMCAERR